MFSEEFVKAELQYRQHRFLNEARACGLARQARQARHTKRHLAAVVTAEAQVPALRQSRDSGTHSRAA